MIFKGHMLCKAIHSHIGPLVLKTARDCFRMLSGYGTAGVVGIFNQTYISTLGCSFGLYSMLQLHEGREQALQSSTGFSYFHTSPSVALSQVTLVNVLKASNSV